MLSKIVPYSYNLSNWEIGIKHFVKYLPKTVTQYIVVMEASCKELFCRSDEQLGLQWGELTRNRGTNKTFDEQYCWARHTEPASGVN